MTLEIQARQCRLFVYGSLLSGERDHSLLQGAELLGEAATEAVFQLIDLGAYAALVRDGNTSVVGELYLVDFKLRAVIDVKREVPILFRRERIKLSDGSEAHAYLMLSDQVRGKRKLHRGDWRKRFAPRVERAYTSPLVKWARSRFSKP